MPNGQSELFKERLKPFLEDREKLQSELRDLQFQVTEKREELKTIDKLLRAGGLLEAPTLNNARKNQTVSKTTLASIIAVIKNLDMKDFAPADVYESGLFAGRSSVGPAFEQLHKEGRLRLVGRKYRAGKREGGVKAVHYAVIEGKL